MHPGWRPRVDCVKIDSPVDELSLLIHPTNDCYTRSVYIRVSDCVRSVRIGIHACVYCETSGTDESYTYCDTCGIINCNGHVRAERPVGELVCSCCAVTERFAFATTYFSDETTLEEFHGVDDAMPVSRKAIENPTSSRGLS